MTQEVTLPPFCALAIFILVIQEIYLTKFCIRFMPSSNELHAHAWMVMEDATTLCSRG